VSGYTGAENISSVLVVVEFEEGFHATDEEVLWFRMRIVSEINNESRY
jgi:hypothetical protein